MVDIYIGIGSNIEPQQNISEVMELLRLRFPSIVFSRIFESEAIVFTVNDFLNLVAKFDSQDLDLNRSGSSDLVAKHTDTSTQLSWLISELKYIEDQLGRTKEGAKFSARVIDIDILLYGDLITETPIELPRDEILLNAYVLWPLSELVPDLIHPASDKSYKQYWNEYDKSTQVLKPIDSIL